MKNHYLKICGVFLLITVSFLIVDSLKSSFKEDIVIEELERINSPESFVQIENEDSQENDFSDLEMDYTQDVFLNNIPQKLNIDHFSSNTDSKINNFKVDSNREILSKRDRTSKHYLREDGKTIDAILSPVSVNYKDANGEWKDIETTLIKSNDLAYNYKNTTNNLKSWFPNNPSEEGIKITTDIAEIVTGKNLKMNWINVDGEEFLSINTGKSLPVVNKNTITYANIIKAVDNQYVVENDKLKHNIILNELPNIPTGAEYLTFSEEIEIPNDWNIDFDQNNRGLVIINDKNEVHLEIPFPQIYEKNDLGIMANDSLSGFDLVKLWNNKYQIKTYIATKWLEERNYPVVVDPTIELNGNYSGYIMYDYDRSWRSINSQCSGTSYDNTSTNYIANSGDATIAINRVNSYSTSYRDCSYRSWTGIIILHMGTLIMIIIKVG